MNTACRLRQTGSAHGLSHRTNSKSSKMVITFSVFGVFSVFYFGERLHWNHFAAFTCLVAGAFFMFHKF